MVNTEPILKNKIKNQLWIVTQQDKSRDKDPNHFGFVDGLVCIIDGYQRTHKSNTKIYIIHSWKDT